MMRIDTVLAVRHSLAVDALKKPMSRCVPPSATASVPEALSGWSRVRSSKINAQYAGSAAACTNPPISPAPLPPACGVGLKPKSCRMVTGRSRRSAGRLLTPSQPGSRSNVSVLVIGPSGAARPELINRVDSAAAIPRITISAKGSRMMLRF